MNDKRTLDDSSNSDYETNDPISIKKIKNNTSSVESVPNTNTDMSSASTSASNLPGTITHTSKGSYVFALSTFNFEEFGDEETLRLVSENYEKDGEPEDTSELEYCYYKNGSHYTPGGCPIGIMSLYEFFGIE